MTEQKTKAMRNDDVANDASSPSPTEKKPAASQSPDKALQRKLQALTLLHAIATASTEARDEDELLTRTTQLVKTNLGLENFGVLLLDKKSNLLRPHPSYQLQTGESPPPISLDKGIVGHVATTGTALRCADIHQETAYFEFDAKTNSELCVPLTIEGQIIGVINAESYRQHAFNEEDERLLTTIAGQLSLAISRLRGVAAAKYRAQQLATLYDVGRQASAILTLDELLPEISRLVRTTLNLYNVEIALLEADKLVFYAGYGGYTDNNKRVNTRLNIGEGITGKVVASGSPLLIPNVSEYPHYLPHPLLPNTQAELAVPLMVKGKVIGALSVKSDQVAGLSDEDAAVLEILAAQIAVAVENARLFKAERERNTELETIRQASLHVTSRLELGPVLHAILEHVLDLAGADETHIFLYDGNRLSFGAAHWAGENRNRPFAEPRENGLTYNVARSGIPLVIPSVQNHPMYRDNIWDGAVAGLPLRIGEQVIGVMNVAFSDPHTFNENELRALALMADQAAIAIRNAELFEAAQRQLQELTTLHAVAMASAETIDKDTLIERATELVGKNLYPENFGVLLLDKNRNTLKIHPTYRGLDKEAKSKPISLGQGITGKVALEEKACRIPDIHKNEDSLVFMPTMHSELCVPLNVSDQVIGVVNAESSHVNAFTAADERLLVTFASQLATAIEKARLFTETTEALAREQRLNEITSTISSSLNLSQALPNVLRLASELVNADAAILALRSEDEASLIKTYSYNMPANSKSIKIPPNQGLAWEIIKSGISIRLTEYSEHPKSLPELVTSGVKATIVVPITSSGKNIGALGLFHMESDIYFSERDVALAESIGRQTGIAIQNARLFAQAQKRAEELAIALKSLEELDQLKNEFIQNVSHELRTPLAIIRGYAELLGNGDFGDLKPEQERASEVINRRVEMLSTMIEELTAILETEAGQMQHEVINIIELINASLADFKVNVKQAGLQLTSEINCETAYVCGDYVKLRRVLDNLMGNALKFTPEGGIIHIHLSQKKQEVILDVIDTGIGIPEDKLDRIFERFYQVDGSMKRRYGGTGLGLALVKEIVEAHQGRVSVHSSAEKGTTFQIILPRAKKETTPTA